MLRDRSKSCDNSGRRWPSCRAGLLRSLGAGTELAPPWPGSVADRRESAKYAVGLATPEEVAVAGFAPDAHAEVIDVSYGSPNHAVVQVGFPDKSAYYWLNIFRHRDGGWRTERP